ncbi:NPC intracellular cholesterol transporter 2 homolog a-like [Thrips palmi]|uniref:NPC intracellular cholesterol transporter 2 homolog a-like n=1 Tax=Thrips palmi TaxID=161013 RepID=A0A6P8ZLR7_THRPL|nr:NPC intracellular cholesterol transporter 2 homolog a-like [Thrips palmi]
MAKLLVLVPALLALAAVVPAAWAADIEDCAEAEDLGKFIEAKVSGCTEDDTKCPLMRGNNVTITIKFKSNKEIKAVQQVVHGVLAGVPVPFPLESPDACQNTGLTCPLVVGDHTYNYGLFIKPVYPKVSVKVKWELLNEDKKQIVCLLIPAILK